MYRELAKKVNPVGGLVSKVISGLLVKQIMMPRSVRLKVKYLVFLT